MGFFDISHNCKYSRYLYIYRISQLAPSRSQYVYNTSAKSLFRIGNDNMSKISGRVRWLRGEEYSKKEWEIKEIISNRVDSLSNIG